MMPMAKPLLLSAAVPLVFVGCTSPNPKAAFDDVSKTVAARTGEEVRWLREDPQSGEIERAVEGLLKTNLTALASASETENARLADCLRLVDEAIGNVRQMSQLLLFHAELNGFHRLHPLHRLLLLVQHEYRPQRLMPPHDLGKALAQRCPVQFAVHGQRQGIQLDEGRRNQVVGQHRCHRLP